MIYRLKVKNWLNKLLIVASLLLIILGSSFLVIGFNLDVSTEPSIFLVPEAPEVMEATEEAQINTLGVDGERVIVSKVVDGDTILLQSGETVRFIGIDTPETVDPRRPVGCFGKEASNETKRLLAGREVILQKDITNTDKYKRLLRYIYLPIDSQMLFVNDYLVREGFAKVYTYPPDTKFDLKFKEAEVQAKEFKKGMWGKCL